MNEIVFIDQNIYQNEIIINNDEIATIYFIDIMKKDLNFNLNISIKNKTKVKIIFCSINSSTHNKEINIFVNHIGNDSLADVNVFSINKDFSNTEVNLTNKIADKSYDNECIQIIKGILLSNDSQITGKPNLLIDTNNVKAKHSLAIGILNPNHLYYLMTKSIPEKESKKILIMSFFTDILNNINDDNERKNIYDKIYQEIGDL